MTEKRTMRARPDIFRRTNGEASEQSAVETLKPSAIQPAERLDSPTAKLPRIKATFYLNAADIVAIDGMQTHEFQRTGKKPERSELVSRAIQLLKQQDSEGAIS